MAAHYWRLLLLCELGCATAIATLYSGAGSALLLVLASIGLLAFLLIPCALVGISFFVMRLANSTQPSRGGSTEVVRAWLTESLALTRAMLAMSLEPWQHSDYDSPAHGAHAQLANPVLLIHGIICNRAVWRPLASALRTHGFGPIRAVNLEPLLADIDTHAAYVADEIRQLRCKCGGARVTLIAHSMGGLVARAALRLLGPEDISQIITLGTPHHGSLLARLLPGLPHRQMQPDSDWLTTLNADQESHLAVPITSIYSAHDNLVIPARSAALAGATRFELRGLGHLSLLRSRPAIDCTLAALPDIRAGREPCLI
jgi:pimeloyl-ACP methyl ester carboxylesterase